MKIKILTIFFLVFASLNFSYSYLEYKFRCESKSNQIKISLKKWKNKIKCLTLINKLNQKLKTSQKNLEKAKKYYDITKKTYRKQIYLIESKKIQTIKTIKKQILNQMKNFENEIFVKIKKILDIYFRKKLKKLYKEEDKLNEQLQEYLNQWDETNFKKTLKNYNLIQQKIYLISIILNSQSFNQLIPVLKLYLSLK